MSSLKLGYNTGYWSSGPPAGITDAIAEAERLGFDSMWAAEAYGSDCFTPMAWWGSQTETIKLGTSIAQMAARTPAATAMAALTLDHLSKGRFMLGLGASGPQVVEGWYGQPYPRPLERTREFVDIVRQVFAREAPVEFSGKHYQIPLEGGTGLGKALKPTVHPYRNDIPILLAAEGPKNVALSAEICDGWMPLFFAPKDNQFYADALAKGVAASSRRDDLEGFEIPAVCAMIPGDDIEACADRSRPMLALYIGGMGAKGKNFHYDVFVRMGFEAECEKIQELYMAGHKKDAIAAVDTKMVEAISLIGPRDKIKDELAQWEESVVTTLMISGPIDLVRFAADIVN